MKSRTVKMMPAIGLLVGLGLLALVLVVRQPASHESAGSSLASLESGCAAGYNVLVVTLDTTRADHLGCYGSATARTPRLDAMADAGIRFDDAVTTAPVTLPSHASILTGLYPPNHGVRNNAEFKLDARHETLAEVMQRRGYETAAFIAAFVLDGRFGLDQGFDLYDDRMPTPEQGFGQDQERPANAVTDAAVDWIRARDPSKPFFAWVHYYDPHAPYLDHGDPQFVDHLYDGEIAYMDAHLGRLTDALDDRELLDQTFVVIVGDHGESLGEHDESGHSRLIYDAVMHMPLILYCPALIQPGVVADAQVSVVDVFPTVLALIGAPPRNGLDGVSLLSPSAFVSRTAYMETMVTYLDNGWAPLFALREHERKYILAPRSEYYDLRRDPKELNNLIDSHHDAVTRHRDRLAADLESRLAEWPTIEEVAVAAQSLDPETVDRLETLGYISGDTGGMELGVHDPKDMMPVWEKIGNAKRRSDEGDHLEAVRLLLEVVDVWPSDRTALRQLGIAYLRAGDQKNAEKYLRRAIDIKPAADVCLLLAQITIVQKRFDETEPLLALALSVEPEHGGVHIARGDLLAAQGRYEQAIASYEAAERIDPYRSKGVVQQRIARARSFSLNSNSNP